MQMLRGERNEAMWGRFTVVIETTNGKSWTGVVREEGTVVRALSPGTVEDLVKTAGLFLESRGCKAFVSGRQQPLENFLYFEEKAEAS